MFLHYLCHRHIDDAPEITTDCTFVDIGCGNGALMLELVIQKL
jgi:hypothetical protein